MRKLCFLYISAMGVGHIKNYDFYLVEETNLSRQMLHNYNDFGKKMLMLLEIKLPILVLQLTMSSMRNNR
ncbi:ThiF family adenylyltransferase [Bartonella callosciuri]|uniref:ThiF family adenylyltransferase n=1 Tax=Bartonella callosciuri TaxID=686223 RepID=UPI0031B586D4